MKLKKILLLLVMLIVVSSTIVFATEADVPVTTSLEKPEEAVAEFKMEENDYFACEENVTLSNMDVMGNIFIVGSTAQLTNVHTTGSIFVVAESLNLSDVRADGSLYVVGANVNVEKTTLKNIYTVSQNVKILEGTMLEKSFYTVSESCEYNATANSEVNILGDNVNIGSAAAVFGKLNVIASSEPEIPDNTIIEDYKFTLADDTDVSVETGFSVSSAIMQILGYVISTAVITFIIFKTMPSLKEKTQDYTIGNMAKNALIGLGLAIAVPIISIILMITGVGSRIGVILILLYVVALMIATIITTIIIAFKIAKNRNISGFKNLMIYILIVSLIVSILEVIPAIGGFVSIVLGLVGFGTVFTLPFSKKVIVKE